MEKGKSVAGSVQFSALSTTTTTHTVEVLGFPTRPSSIYFLLLVNINNDETKSTANKWQIRFCFCFYSPAQQKPPRTPNAPFLGKTKTKQKTCRLTGNPPLCERKSATYLLLPGMDAIHVGWLGGLLWIGLAQGGAAHWSIKNLPATGHMPPPPPSRTERKDTLSASLNIHFIMSRHCLLKILLHLPHKVLSTRGSILHIDGYTYNSYHFSTCNLMKWNI